MSLPARLAAPLMLGLLAACGGNAGDAEGERRTAAGEVLGGSISDDMLPLDTVTSESPPLREEGSSDNSAPRPATTGGAASNSGTGGNEETPAAADPEPDEVTEADADADAES